MWQTSHKCSFLENSLLNIQELGFFISWRGLLRAPKVKRSLIVPSFMAKSSPCLRIPSRGITKMGACFLTTPQWLGGVCSQLRRLLVICLSLKHGAASSLIISLWHGPRYRTPKFSCKEAAFIWIVWHKDVTLNEVTGMKLFCHHICPMHIMCA